VDFDKTSFGKPDMIFFNPERPGLLSFFPVFEIPVCFFKSEFQAWRKNHRKIIVPFLLGLFVHAAFCPCTSEASLP
jgi:hypothetical protein